MRFYIFIHFNLRYNDIKRLQEEIVKRKSGRKSIVILHMVNLSLSNGETKEYFISYINCIKGKERVGNMVISISPSYDESTKNDEEVVKDCIEKIEKELMRAYKLDKVVILSLIEVKGGCV